MDINIVHNVFDDFECDKINYLFDGVKYYSKDNYPDEEVRNNVSYIGKRSETLYKALSDEDHNWLASTVINKFSRNFLNNQNFDIEMGGYITMHFHQMMETDTFKESWWHRDIDSVYAGVIYLSESDDKSCGTQVKTPYVDVYCPDDKNSMIMYNANFLHSAKGGYGDNIHNCRKTLLFFFSDIEMKVKNLANRSYNT